MRALSLFHTCDARTIAGTAHELHAMIVVCHPFVIASPTAKCSAHPGPGRVIVVLSELKKTPRLGLSGRPLEKAGMLE